MKIGFLIYSLQGGGAERMVSKLVNYMVDQRQEVTLFLMNGEKVAYSINSDAEVVVIALQESRNQLKRAFERLRRIHHEVKTRRIDVLFAFTTTMYPYAAIACRHLNTRVIGAERANPQIYGKQMQMAIKLVSPLCDGFVFQTEGAKDYYPKAVAKKAAVIPNAAPKVLCERKEREDCEMRFCTVGRLHTDKDFDTLIDAFALYLKDYPGSRLTIFGDGELRPFYEKRCRDMHIERQIVFAGFVKNVYEQLAEYDAFVFSSKSEGMPNAILEAMAVGLPCLSTDCDYGPRELIQHGISGLLCKVADPEDMAEKMKWMAEHRKECIQMGKRARAACEDYSEEKILGSYLTYAMKML